MMRAALGAILFAVIAAGTAIGAQPDTQPSDIDQMRQEVQRLRRELEDLRRQKGEDPQPTKPPAQPKFRLASPDPNTPADAPPPEQPQPPRFRLSSGVPEETIPEEPFAIGHRPPLRPAQSRGGLVTDKEIGDSIARAADFILTRAFDDSGKLKIHLQAPPESQIFKAGDRSLEAGLHALCVYALLQASQAINDERLSVRGQTMKRLIDNMKRLNADGAAATYTHGLRLTALAIYNRAEDRPFMRTELAYLLENLHGGCYTYGTASAAYGTRDKTIRFGDNSNAQYGLLGVWSAAEVGLEVPQDYWRMVESHWFESQFPDGRWGYLPQTATPAAQGLGISPPPPILFIDPENGAPKLSMTLAGTASLFVTHDYIDAVRFGKEVGRKPFSIPLQRALKWLETGDNIVSSIGPGQGGYGGGYNLYGIERVGLASGFKYFGKHDWYRELAATLIARQQGDGSFGDIVETAYSLLFLARGRHPIIMNKLRFDGAWANRPRDVANLARFASRELERPLNWQVVPLERDWTDWSDCPVLYIASHQPIKLLEADFTNLRSFIDSGGLLFTQSDGAAPAFNSFIYELGKKLYPDYQWTDLPADSDIYTLHFKINPKPRLRCLSNGSRILMLHSPEDISVNWQLRSERTKRNTFELGVNIFLYATGKTDLRNRLAGRYLPPPPVNPTSRLPLARVKYAGNWNPEPYAWTHFARLLQYQTGLSVTLSDIPATDLNAAKFPLAHLTGASAFHPTPAESAAIRTYVNDGGVLLIDACGGSTAFDTALTSPAGLLAKAFPGATPEPLPADHPLYTGRSPGMDPLLRPLIRSVVTVRSPHSSAKITLLRSGKGCLIYSPLDLTSGILGATTYTTVGYTPAYAQSFAKNLLLWTWDGRVGAGHTPPPPAR